MRVKPWEAVRAFRFSVHGGVVSLKAVDTECTGRGGPVLPGGANRACCAPSRARKVAGLTCGTIWALETVDNIPGRAGHAGGRAAVLLISPCFARHTSSRTDTRVFTLNAGSTIALPCRSSKPPLGALDAFAAGVKVDGIRAGQVFGFPAFFTVQYPRRRTLKPTVWAYVAILDVVVVRCVGRVVVDVCSRHARLAYSLTYFVYVASGTTNQTSFNEVPC